ncbi:MAG: 4-hydroxythreonine-4-phosphate dehydrogenase PdxA [Deltaproteobacteria bacterium]|nr:4-hydroxythreonine-4-phosphate dehydrogenase PdxA [Deltaproteobacteria bacterium]
MDETITFHRLGEGLGGATVRMKHDKCSWSSDWRKSAGPFTSTWENEEVPFSHRIAIATGDPAGVGPWVSIAALASIKELQEKQVGFVLFGDRAQLEGIAASMGLDPSSLAIVHAGSCDREVIEAHEDNPASGAIALRALDLAIDSVQSKETQALVTAPVSKAAIRMAGHGDFVGQTEHLARRASLPDEAVSMLFIGPRLKVGLVTTHLPLRAVPDALSAERIARTVRHLGQALLCLGTRPPFGIAVCGLNPHAGESGAFGNEEKEVIAPTVLKLQSDPFLAGQGIEVIGPIPSESAFRQAAQRQVAGVVALYHDQATIPTKLLDWGHSVNVTWGLPFIRTSVDHGVAYDAARQKRFESQGMRSAIALAIELAKAHPEVAEPQ